MQIIKTPTLPVVVELLSNPEYQQLDLTNDFPPTNPHCRPHRRRRRRRSSSLLHVHLCAYLIPLQPRRSALQETVPLPHLHRPAGIGGCGWWSGRRDAEEEEN